jgi:hypothetical protein
MAGGALLRCWCVEQNQAPSHFLAILVAAGARYFFVSAVKTEARLVVIESRLMPQARAMARCAILGAAGERAKLTQMDVFMAPCALTRRVAVDYALQPRRYRRLAMALFTRDSFVRTSQCKPGVRVVERQSISPRTHVVARFAACPPICR